MKSTLFSLSGAALLLLSISCNGSDSSEVDASIANDASVEPDSTPGTGGSFGTGGALATGGVTGGGGQTTGAGGVGTGGSTSTGGSTGTGGTGQLCAGLAALPCAKGQFCEYRSGQCTIPDGIGTCALIPDLCPAIYLPVCGCDGKTYGNDCERQSAGVSKRADGTCSSEGKMCGGIAGIRCDKRQFCDLAPGDCGTIADGAGTCVVTDIVCVTLYRPVCGCDGKTYPNDCNRQVAGVFKAADGACPVIDGGVDR